MGCAAEYNVGIVGFVGVWHDRQTGGFGQSANFDHFGDPAGLVGIRLEDIDGAAVQQPQLQRCHGQRRFNSAWDSTSCGMSGSSIQERRNSRKEIGHFHGVAEVPPHAGVGGQFDFIPHGVADRADQLCIFVHSCASVFGAEPEPLRHTGEAEIFPAAGLIGQHIKVLQGVQAAYVAGNAGLGGASEQRVDRFALGFAVQIPAGDVEGGSFFPLDIN